MLSHAQKRWFGNSFTLCYFRATNIKIDDKPWTNKHLT